jgi:hypothetical protein
LTAPRSRAVREPAQDWSSPQPCHEVDRPVLFLACPERGGHEVRNACVGQAQDAARDSVLVSSEDDILRPGGTFAVENGSVLGYLTCQAELITDPCAHGGLVGADAHEQAGDHSRRGAAGGFRSRDHAGTM